MQVSIGLLFSVWNHHYEDLIFLVACFFDLVCFQSYWSNSDRISRAYMCDNNHTQAKTKKKSDWLESVQTKKYFIFVLDKYTDNDLLGFLIMTTKQNISPRFE